MAEKATDTSNQPTTGSNHERSTPYPGLLLADAITATEKLRKSYGASSTYSREAVAESLGHQGVTGPASKKIAALSHYGLLDRQGSVYKQSDISNRIFNNLTDAERTEAIVEAFQTPALYQKLIQEFNHQGVPTALDKVLIRNYNITEKAAKQAAKVFTESATFAGVLVNGVLNIGSKQEISEVANDETPDDVEEEIISKKEQKEASQTAFPKDKLPVEIPGTGVVILFPTKYAFDLSIGSFANGIKALKLDIDTSDTTNVPAATDDDSHESTDSEE